MAVVAVGLAAAAKGAGALVVVALAAVAQEAVAMAVVAMVAVETAQVAWVEADWEAVEKRAVGMVAAALEMACAALTAMMTEAGQAGEAPKATGKLEVVATAEVVWVVEAVVRVMDCTEEARGVVVGKVVEGMAEGVVVEVAVAGAVVVAVGTEAEE